MKTFKSKNYNYIFNEKDGFFARWGKTLDEDPLFSPYGPEIADIEISTVCSGVGKLCLFCYKSNTSKGQNMSLKTFTELFSKLPKTITQIAFGIGDVDGNPEMYDIFSHCRENKVVPNVTINGANLTDYHVSQLASLCGAAAVSLYDTDITFNAVKRLADHGLKQVNIHFMIAEETYERAFLLFDEVEKDKRLKDLNAIVFLSLKKKGRAEKGYTQLSQEKFSHLVSVALQKSIAFGFDSCSAQKFLKTIEGHENEEAMKCVTESCESSLFSSYFNVNGDFFPCSFIEGTPGWETGIKLNGSNDFLGELWFNSRVNAFRKSVIDCARCKRACPHYEV